MRRQIGAALLVSLMCVCLIGCDAQSTKKTSTHKTDKPSKSVATTGTETGESSTGTTRATTGNVGYQRFDDIELSDKYLVGFDYSDYDIYNSSAVVIAKVRYDKKIEVEYTYPKTNGESHTQTVVYDLTDQQYDNIEKEIDLRKLYELDPEEADPDTTYDGGYNWLLIYDKEDNIAKMCGGFCPHSKLFWQMRNAIFDVVF